MTGTDAIERRSNGSVQSRRGVPHPIPYQGSKRALAPSILTHLPSDVPRLVEPFAGSAAISLAAAHRGITGRFWLNDAHKPLIALWDEILKRPERLAENYRALWDDQQGREREFFDKVRDRFNRSARTEHFLYLLARCVKAAVRYNSNGEFNNAPDNRRKGAKPQEMAARVLGASALLRGKTLLTALDYRDVLANCTPADLIYMDPPYQGVAKNRDHRYLAKISHGEFEDALENLNLRGCRYLVSYDGRTGDTQHGKRLAKHLGLVRLEVCAGRSTQATLLGRNQITFESLYLSPALADDLRTNPQAAMRSRALTVA